MVTPPKLILKAPETALISSSDSSRISFAEVVIASSLSDGGGAHPQNRDPNLADGGACRCDGHHSLFESRSSDCVRGGPGCRRRQRKSPAGRCRRGYGRLRL